jgi:hypothetical protein
MVAVRVNPQRTSTALEASRCNDGCEYSQVDNQGCAHDPAAQLCLSNHEVGHSSERSPACLNGPTLAAPRRSVNMATHDDQAHHVHEIPS